ncbi:MAG: ABC transporter permease [Alphaproteobacteria bacterium]
MSRFISQRVVETIVVLLAMSFVVYGLIGLMPGDPVDIMISGNPHMTSTDATRLRALYGLDRPIVERYWTWLTAALHGNLGYSRIYQQPVLAVLWPRLGNSAVLMGTSFVLGIVIAVPLGVWAALRPQSKIDYLINLGAFAGISVPVFWLGLLLIILFSVKLGWLPAGGMGTAAGFGDVVTHLALPVAALTLSSVGNYVRYVRAAMIETLRQDFIRTAMAKGASPARVIWRHAFRNSLIPVVTIIGLSFGALFSGALLTETMFAYPGMGKLIYDSIMGNDFNLALVGLLFATLMTLLGNLFADLAYSGLDPRIALGATRSR